MVKRKQRESQTNLIFLGRAPVTELENTLYALENDLQPGRENSGSVHTSDVEDLVTSRVGESKSAILCSDQSMKRKLKPVYDCFEVRIFLTIL